MTIRLLERLPLIAALAALLLSVACDQHTPIAPPIAARAIAPEPLEAPLTITAISPDHGSVEGGTPVRLTGSGFRASTQVSLDGVHVGVTVYLDSVFFVAPARQSGPIDVVVSNPGGESVTLVGGFTYVLPESLILDGIWVGWVGNLHVPVTFTVQDNAVISVTCDLAPPILLSPPVPIRQARFSIDQDSVSVMSGVFHSNQYGIGDMNIGTCLGRWDAGR